MSQTEYRTRLRDLRRSKALKEKRDITYRDIANATGLSYQTVHRYATKSIPKPDFDTLVKLADYFGVTLDEMVYQAGDDLGQRAAVA